MVYKYFDKKTAGSDIKSMTQNERPLDLATQQLAEELHNPFQKNENYIQHSKKEFGVLI